MPAFRLRYRPFLAIVLALLLVAPAAAQDGTPVAAPPTPPATATAAPTDVPTAAPATATATPTDVPTAAPATATATATATGTATATATPTAPAAHISGPALVRGYLVSPPAGWGTWQTAGTVYRPRQFVPGQTISDPTYPTDTVVDASIYRGFDTLTTYNVGLQRRLAMDGWMTVRLDRPATVVVVWRGGNPRAACFTGWDAGQPVAITRHGRTRTHPTFVRVVTDTLAVCGVNTGAGDVGVRDTPVLLFGEADGSPTLDPPGGIAPNRTCPASLVDTAGWTPQIDPTYWCYTRADHGSNPNTCYPGYDPQYGVAARAMGMNEPYPGFKTLVFDAVDGRTRWCLTVHMGTTGMGRICEPIHSATITAIDRATGAVLADVHLLLDFGPSVHNDSGRTLTPSACPDQGQDAIDRGVQPGARRRIPIVGATQGYEPWTPWLAHARQFAWAGPFTLNTYDAKTSCDSLGCTSLVPSGGSGSLIYFQGSTFGFAYPAGTALPTGTFCTDPMGRNVVACGSAGAVAQYVSPALVGRTVRTGANRAQDVDGFGAAYVADGGLGRAVVASAREGSIRPEDAN